jgi:hypothetical protein
MVFPSSTILKRTRTPRSDEAMSGVSGLMNTALVDAYDWGQFRTLVDIGGGSGSTLAAILEANPNVSGILFDRDHVIERGQELLAQRGLSDRCRTHVGSFFDAVPTGADGYFMKHILHDWTDEDCLRILHACHRAMPDNARLLVCEKVIVSGNDRQFGKLTDLVMLAMTDGGRERTETEFRDLLAAVSFHLVRIVPTRSDNALLEVMK